MKCKIIFSVTLAIFLTVLLIAYAASQEQIVYQAYDANVNVVFNNKPFDFKDNLYIINGGTYAPLREIAEREGAEVEWIDETRTIDIYKSPFFDSKKLFEVYMGFRLSSESSIITYSHFSEPIDGVTDYHEDRYFSKIEIFETDRKNLIEFCNYYCGDTDREEDYDNIPFDYCIKNFAGWDLYNISSDTLVYSYGGADEIIGRYEMWYIITEDYLYALFM